MFHCAAAHRRRIDCYSTSAETSFNKYRQAGVDAIYFIKAASAADNVPSKERAE